MPQQYNTDFLSFKTHFCDIQGLDLSYNLFIKDIVAIENNRSILKNYIIKTTDRLLSNIAVPMMAIIDGKPFSGKKTIMRAGFNSAKKQGLDVSFLYTSDISSSPVCSNKNSPQLFFIIDALNLSVSQTCKILRKACNTNRCNISYLFATTRYKSIANYMQTHNAPCIKNSVLFSIPPLSVSEKLSILEQSLHDGALCSNLIQKILSLNLPIRYQQTITSYCARILRGIQIEKKTLIIKYLANKTWTDEVKFLTHHNKDYEFISINILQAVCAMFSLGNADLMSSSKRHSYARSLAIFMLRNNVKMSFKEIAERLSLLPSTIKSSYYSIKRKLSLADLKEQITRDLKILLQHIS